MACESQPVIIDYDDNEILIPTVPIIINNQYSFIKSCEYKIGRGRYHDTYYGIDINTNQYVAIKYNHYNNKHQDVYLKWQYQKYKMMKDGIGIPNIYWYGEIDRYKIVIMDLFDATLQQLFEFCNYKFSLKTILMIADKLLMIIEHIHNNKNLYRNINPIHFVVKNNNIYIVGFGNVKYYINPKTQRHIALMENMRMKNIKRFASMNEHLGYELSRRDDLESIGNVLLYFLYQGKLAWSGLKREGNNKNIDIVGNKKMKILIQDLCKNYPKEFELYIKHCRGLQFEEKPNYEYLRKLFKDLYVKNGYDKKEFVWDWDLRKLFLINGYYRNSIQNKLIICKDILQLISRYIIPVFINGNPLKSVDKRKYDIL